jgi:hypothetical protein
MPMMPSTAIRSLSYDVTARELWVMFTTGRRYVYSDVPPEVYRAFFSATSRGTFFNQEIRDRYPYREITSRDRKAS